MRRVKLEEMPWTEVDAARREGFETVIIPTHVGDVMARDLRARLAPRPA